MPKNFYIISFIVLVVTNIALAGGYDSYQDLTFTADYDGSSQKYIKMLPDGFNASNSYDLIIALHGHGSDRWQFATDTRDECRATRDIAAANNMIYISPDYRATTSWMGPAAEADTIQLINSLKQQYNINNVIMTGGSMGGSSSLTFTARNPQMVDGVSALNALADHTTYNNFQTEIAASFGGTKTEVPDEYYNRSAINFTNSFTMPVAVTAGGQDTSVPPQSVQQFYDNVSAVNSKTIEFYRADVGHSTNYVDTAVALEYVIRQVRGVDPQSNPITLNTSFESQEMAAGEYVLSQADGWSVVSLAGGVAGVVNSDAAAYAADYNEPKPDGDNLAFAKQSAMFQYLGGQVQEGVYTLTLQAGSQLSNAEIGTFLAGFMTADSNVAASSDLVWANVDSYLDVESLVAGEWSEITLQWEVLEGDVAIGQELYLNLYADSDNYVHFDDISVSFIAVPEPVTLTLLAAGAFAMCRRKKK